MKTSILKQVLEQKIALRAEIILIFEAFSKQKPQFEIICEQIQVRNLNCQGKALQFKIFDKLSQSRKVIEVFSIDKFQDNIFNIIEYAQKSKNLVRQDLIWKVFDCYYLDEDMLFYAVEYEDYDFTCLEIQHNKEISSQFELEQYLQEIYAYSQQSLNPNIKQKITQNLCQSAYYVFQKQNNNQTSVKLCTVHPYLFQEVIGYCKYFCQIPSALKIKNNQDFNLLKQKTEKNDKKTLFQQIQHFSPSFLDQNPKIIEHIINTENDLEKYQLTSVNVEEGYFTLNGESANNLTIFQIHKFNSEEAANQKLEEFKQISQQLNEINIQVTTNFEILPNQQLTYLIIKTKQIKSNRNLYNFIQIFNELYNNLDCCLLEIPCWDESLLNNIYKLSYLLPPRVIPKIGFLPRFPSILPPPPFILHPPPPPLMLPPPPLMLPPPPLMLPPPPLMFPPPPQFILPPPPLIPLFLDQSIPLNFQVILMKCFELVKNLIKFQDVLFKLKIKIYDIQVSNDLKLIASENIFRFNNNSNNSQYISYSLNQYEKIIIYFLQYFQKLFTKVSDCIIQKQNEKYVDSKPFQIMNQCITDYFYSYKNEYELTKNITFKQPEQYLKQLEIVINLNKMVEGNLFGISPFGFENITFIIQNQGNKSLKIISKLLQENTNFDIIHFYSGFLFYENFLQLKKQIDDYIQSDYFIYFYESLDEILAQQCFKDFSTNQKTKISNLYSEYKKINNTEFDQGNLEIQFCSCVLEARINRLQGICMLSNYVMNQNILGDDTDEKFICICNMLNSITNMVIKNQKNLKIFKFQVYLCGNVKKQLEGQEDYFGLSDKLNLFLLDISYFTQQSNQIFYRKLIFNQLKKNLRNVSTLNLSEKVEKRPSKLNIFKKLKRVVCINII